MISVCNYAKTCSATRKDIECHTKLIDQKNSLQKIELKLQKQNTMTTMLPVHHKTITRSKDLVQINIACIRTVGFQQHLTNPNTTLFITSLYKINRIIEEKEAEAIQADSAREELDNEELINQKLPHQ